MPRTIRPHTQLGWGSVRFLFPAMFGIFLLAMTTATAQIDRTRQPVSEPAPTVTFPDFEQFTLSNGLLVFFVHDDRPMVTMRLLVRGGEGGDGKTPGLSDGAADLLTKGTTSRSAQEFAESIDFIGGTISASAGLDAISVGASGLKKHLPSLLALFTDAVRSPAYDSAELAKYIHEQISSLTADKARADYLADAAVRRVVYGNTPYGAMPSEQSLAEITPERLQAYHSAYFVPSNATLAVVGNFTVNELKDLLEQTIGGWSGGRAPTIRAPKFPDSKGRRVILIDRPTAVQSAVRVIGRGPLPSDNDRPMVTILNSILGGGTGLGNRLAMNLRETHAWTYTPYSYFDAMLFLGHFVAAADVRNDVTDSAITEILREIERLGSEDVPADELDRNIKSAVGGYLMSVADPNITASRVQSIQFHNLPADYYDRLVTAYQGTNAQTIKRLAERYLDVEDLDIVVVGKASEVAAMLAKFGTVEMLTSDLEVDHNAMRTDLKIKPEEIWQKMLKAMGGTSKMRAVKSLVSTARIEALGSPMPLVGTYSSNALLPNQRRIILDIGSTPETRISNGIDAWRVMQDRPRLLSGNERDATIEGARIHPEAWLDELDAKLELVGETEVDGKMMYIIRMIYPSGSEAVYSIDKKTWLPYRIQTPLYGTMTIEGWDTVGGIKYPDNGVFELDNGNAMKFSDAVSQPNVPVDATLFQPN